MVCLNPQQEKHERKDESLREVETVAPRRRHIDNATCPHCITDQQVKEECELLSGTNQIQENIVDGYAGAGASPPDSVYLGKKGNHSQDYKHAADISYTEIKLDQGEGRAYILNQSGIYS
jgi:hypothetical protein